MRAAAWREMIGGGKRSKDETAAGRKPPMTRRGWPSLPVVAFGGSARSTAVPQGCDRELELSVGETRAAVLSAEAGTIFDPLHLWLSSGPFPGHQQGGAHRFDRYRLTLPGASGVALRSRAAFEHHVMVFTQTGAAVPEPSDAYELVFRNRSTAPVALTVVFVSAEPHALGSYTISARPTP